MAKNKKNKKNKKQSDKQSRLSPEVIPELTAPPKEEKGKSQVAVDLPEVTAIISEQVTEVISVIAEQVQPPAQPLPSVEPPTSVIQGTKIEAKPTFSKKKKGKKGKSQDTAKLPEAKQTAVIPQQVMEVTSAITEPDILQKQPLPLVEPSTQIIPETQIKAEVKPTFSKKKKGKKGKAQATVKLPEAKIEAETKSKDNVVAPVLTQEKTKDSKDVKPDSYEHLRRTPEEIQKEYEKQSLDGKTSIIETEDTIEDIVFSRPSYWNGIIKQIINPYGFFESTLLNWATAYNSLLIYSFIALILYLYWGLQRATSIGFLTMQKVLPVYFAFMIIILPASALLAHLLAKSFKNNTGAKTDYKDSLAIISHSCETSFIMFIILTSLLTLVNYWQRICGMLTAFGNASQITLMGIVALCVIYACFLSILGFKIIYGIREYWSATIIIPVYMFISILSIYLYKTPVVKIFMRLLGIRYNLR